VNTDEVRGMMVRELIEELKKFEQEKEVGFACDEEGNNIYKKVVIELYDRGIGVSNKIIVVLFPYGNDSWVD
jgi:hypothetical protein